jgi:hypothetical protein
MMAITLPLLCLHMARSQPCATGETLDSLKNLETNHYSILHAVCYWKEFMALKRASWLKKLHENGNLYQCLDCQQHHAQNCSQREQCHGGIDSTTVLPAAEQSSPRTIIPSPTSWLPSLLRRQKRGSVDVETSAESPNESSCLITPLTDDDILPDISIEDDCQEEQSIEHREDTETLVRKKVKKGSKKSTRDSAKGQGQMDKAILV